VSGVYSLSVSPYWEKVVFALDESSGVRQPYRAEQAAKRAAMNGLASGSTLP
jgi:hypothetical protein